MATSMIKKSMDITTGYFSKNNIAVGANAFVEETYNVSKSGYTPIGIITINKSGSGSGHCVISQFRISDNNAIVAIRNLNSTAATVSMSITVLYKELT